MPGGGKSTVGRLVARKLGLGFVDSDQAIEDQAGCSIATLFEHEGEEGFRHRELEMLAQLVAAGSGVIATGGGAVLRPDNRALLRMQTHCVYLRVAADVLMHRLRRDTRRPLLQVADPQQRILELIGEREPLYREAAAAVVDTAGLSLSRVVAAVIASMPAPDQHQYLQ